MSDLFSEQDHETFEKAIETWGELAQVEMAEEEAAEYIVASKHFRREKIDRLELIDEIADVRIMVEQLMHVYPRAEIKHRVDQKMDRLRERIEE